MPESDITREASAEYVTLGEYRRERVIDHKELVMSADVTPGDRTNYST